MHDAETCVLKMEVVDVRDFPSTLHTCIPSPRRGSYAARPSSRERQGEGTRSRYMTTFSRHRTDRVGSR